jgi:hypothetical protein
LNRRQQRTYIILRVIYFFARYWQWSFRLVALYFLLSLIAPPTPRTIMDTPQIVETIQPHLCVHTRVIDEVFEFHIQRTFQMVREMGASTIVEFFPWAYFENAKGNIDWARADMIIRHAQNQGLKIIARMGFVPEWARPAKEGEFTTLNELPEESYDDFARFVAAFAARYTGTVEHLIIWNEPNLALEWGYHPPDPIAYSNLLKIVYPAVKMANPNVVILAGALAPTLEPVESPHGMNDLLYLEAMYQAGVADYFDALAVHTYGLTLPAADDPSPDKLNFRRVELLYEIMLRYDSPDKPVYITESGWNDHPRWTKAVRPSQRIQYTLEALDIVANDWAWAKTLCLWAFRYPRYTYSYPDNFMLVGVGFERTPIYAALQAYALGRTSEGTLWLPPPGASSTR